MPIKVVCQCGAAFAAKDELAGRTVACPKCKQPLKIGTPQAAPVAQAAPAAPVHHANADLFDDVGLRARATNMARCPSCDSDLPPNAVLCVKCGYNFKLGKKMQTMNMAADGAPVAGGHGGHGGDVTAMIMARAAQNAEDDKSEEKKKTNEGMPLWTLVVGVVACILFGIVMSLIEQSTALIGTGLLLIFANFCLVIFAWVGIVVTAFIKKPLFGVIVLIGDLGILAAAIACVLWISDDTVPYVVRLFFLMLIGACSTGYAYTDEDCAKFLFFSWLAYVMRCVGLSLLVLGIVIGAFSKDDSQSALPPVIPAPVAIAVVSDPGHHGPRILSLSPLLN